MAELILAGSQHDFPVVEDGRVLGVSTRDDFLAVLTRQGPQVSVVSVMRSGLPEVDSYEMVENALERIRESGAPVLPVTHAGQLVGMINAENITEFLMIRSAIKSGSVVVIGPR